MATLNFPSDTSQSPYEENGYTYEWDGEKWNITSSPGGGGSSDYVLPTATDVRLGGIKVGNNLTVDGSGVLSADVQDGTVGTLQQVTDAGNTTTNDIRINANAATVPLRLTRETDVANSGVLHIRSNIGGDDIIHSVFYADGQLDIGGDISGNAPNITLAAAGYSSFAKTVKVRVDGSGSLISADSPVTQYYYTDGGVSVARVDKDGTHKIGGVPDSAPNITLNADGSGIFKNDVLVGGNANNGLQNGVRLFASGAIKCSAGSSDVLWTGHTTGNSTATSSIKGDGSAEFAGTVQVGDDNPDRIKLFADGLISIRRDDGDILNVYKDGLAASNRTVEINSSGSAEFAEQVQTSKYFWSRNEGVPSSDNSTGGLYLYNNDAGSSGTRSDAALVISPTSTNNGNSIRLNYDGSGSFAGAVGFAGSGPGTSYLTNQSASFSALGKLMIRQDVASQNVFEVYYGDGSTLTTQLKSDGRATFAGAIQSGGAAFDGENGFRTASAGTVYVCSVATTGAANVGAIWQGYTEGNTTPTSTIYSNGSASFAKRVSVGSPTLQNDHSISAVNNAPGLAPIVSVQYDTNGSVFQGRNGAVDDNVTTAQINADGSASFASGNCDINSDGLLRVKRSAPSGSGGLLVYPDNDFSKDSVVALNTDGSANFANSVTISDPDITDNAAIGAAVHPGLIVVKRESTVGSDKYVFQGYKGTQSTSAITADGNAEFADSVKIGGYNPGSNGVKGFFYSEDEGLVVQGRVSADPLVTCLGGNSTDIVVQLSADGSASFAGNIQAGGQPSDGTAIGVRVNAYGSIMTCRDTAEDTVFVGYLQGNTTTTSRINADGSASFAGNIQAAGLTDGTTTKTMTEVLAGGAGGASALYYGSYDHNNDTVTGSGGFTATENGTGFLRVTFDSAFANADDYILLYSVPACPDHLINMKSNNMFQIQMKDGAGAAKTYSVDFAILPTDSSAFSIVAQNHVQTNERNNQISQALTSLKTAAAASTNHDELKAAIASALANF